MKRLFIIIICLLSFTTAAMPARAGSCESDPIVKHWLKEKEEAATNVVQKWARGLAFDLIAAEIAVLISNEINLFSQCREESEYINRSIYILNQAGNSGVEAVPAIILERIIGENLLSPRRQFPDQKEKETQ